MLPPRGCPRLAHWEVDRYKKCRERREPSTEPDFKENCNSPHQYANHGFAALESFSAGKNLTSADVPWQKSISNPNEVILHNFLFLITDNSAQHMLLTISSMLRLET